MKAERRWMMLKTAGLPWRRNFYNHTHPIPIAMKIPMGIPMSTAESRAAVGTEFLSPYPPIPIPMADLQNRLIFLSLVWL